LRLTVEGRKVYGLGNVFERSRLTRLTGSGWRSHGGHALLGLLVIAAICVAAPGAALAASFTGPLLTGPPTIAGSPLVGETLTATAPTSGAPGIVVAYAWQRCDAAGAGCAAIPGATGATHQLTSADAGAKIVAGVRATDGTPADDSSGSSDAVGPVTSPAPPPPPPPPRVPPTIGEVMISGSAVVGQTLTAAATVTGDLPITLVHQWQRCGAGGAGCEDIAGATGSQYTLADADLGRTVRVQLTASDGAAPDASARSAPTAPVVAAPAEASFDTSSSAARPVGTQPGGLTTGAAGTGGAATGPGRPRVLTPFPAVRLRGRLLGSGAYVTLFHVTAPVGVRVEVSCTGRGCPRRRVAFVARKPRTRVHAFEGLLPAGVHLAVRIWRPGYVGKVTTFVIHANAAPTRTDRCAAAASGKVVRCAA
jgi:hypothetical protein